MKALIQKILVVCLMVTGVAGNVWGADARWTNGGTFTSSITLNESVTIPTGKTVTINGDLTIKPNSNNPVTLTVNGTLVVTGNIILKTGNNGKWYSDDYYGNLTNNGTVTANNITVGSGSTLTVAGVENMKIAGDLTNNGNVTIPNNLVVEGNITNNGTITMNGGVLRVGTKESDGKVKSGTGNLTLNDDSSLLFGNNGGKESLIEVGGNLIGDEEAYIKSSKGGKGKLAVVGTYYDYVDEQDVYHPDWGVSVDRLLLGTIIGLDFELKDNPNVFLSANRYELPDISGSLINDILDALGWTDTDGKIRDILSNKSINSGNLNEILQEISEALPIELVYFRAQQDDGNVEFTWQTASELNNDYFTIEYSLNAIDFEELAIVAGSGTTTETVDYQYAELSANYSGTVYYRLKQTDYDGNFTYSDMVTLTFAEKDFDEEISAIIVYPNPATDIINVDGQFERIAVCDFQGRVLSVAPKGEKTLNVSNLSSGTYYVKVTTEGEQRLIPFVKR